MNPPCHRTGIVGIVATGWWLVAAIHAPSTFAFTVESDGYHVFPGDRIQDALEAAAKNPTNKIVKVHAGVYRPDSKRQALIWFNRAHDGIRLEAVGSVTLTAANPEVTSPRAQGFPAVVNHVVYFGDGISSNTILQGFRITGANHFVTDKQTRQMEPDTTIPKNLFFYTDGGGIKIFGRSSPTLRQIEVVDNYASPCGAGISVQQMGFNQSPVLIENCVFLRNRTQVTGAAVDLLEGSAAVMLNCLFVGNVSNTGDDVVARRSGEPPFTNCGAITIFTNSHAVMRHCTLTGNRNGIDDMGGRSTYLNCLFINNRLTGNPADTDRYELDLLAGATVRGCLINGVVRDPRRSVSATANVLNPPPPEFDRRFVPTSPEYQAAGFRPVPGLMESGLPKVSGAR